MSEKAGEIYYDIEADVSGLLKAQGKANKSLDSIGNSATTAAKKMDELQTNINRVAGAIAASLVVDWGKAFLVAADNMSQLNARIERLTGSAAAASQTMQNLMRISSATGGSLQDTAKLWETLSTALRDTGATNGQIIQLTETLQKIGRIGGSSSEEMANALRQFGQSISSGTVRAEEFNSILEQMPELARQIAAGMGVSIGELRQLMLDGKLTAEDALNAIQKQTGSVNAEFEKLPRTLSQANTALTNSFLSMIDSVNQATGASSGLVAIIDSMAAALDRLVGKAASADAQISDLNSTAEMFTRRARTWSWLGLDGWEAQNKALAGLSNKAAMLVGDLAAVSKASQTAANTKPIEIKTTATGKKAKGGKSAAQKEAEQYAKSQESVNQKLDELKQKSEISAGSTAELSKAQAMLNAQLSLGKDATLEQIRLAGDYAAKIWDTANALKQQAQAQQANKAASQLISNNNATPHDGMTFGAQDPFAEVNQQEQQKLDVYQQFRNADLISQQTYEQAKAAISQEASDQRLQITQNELEQQRQFFDSTLGSTQQFFGSMADAIGNYAGEASGAYKAMFAVSKGFAIAQAGMNLVMAISNAAALPWPANIPAIAAAAAQGAALVSQISSMNYGGGRKNGGPVSAGSMYQVGESGMPEIYQASTGKQYMIPGDNGKVISNKDLGGGGGQIQVSIQFNDYSSGAHSYDAQATQNGSTLTVQAFIMDMDQGGQMSQSITRNIQAQRRARE
ncbi:tape measure protein [Citrobacter portucalensis]|uniref:tape measure protein n=1 Tax=Citrobacter portucalensis TaxID=1639133 RepID=UPI00254D2285|nr:tape measure protein [Citrobacter portucalensis]HBK4928811.1 tape measure protein [Citrobacter freundii]